MFAITAGNDFVRVATSNVKLFYKTMSRGLRKFPLYIDKDLILRDMILGLMRHVTIIKWMAS